MAAEVKCGSMYDLFKEHIGAGTLQSKFQGIGVRDRWLRIQGEDYGDVGNFRRRGSGSLLLFQPHSYIEQLAMTEVKL